MNKLLSPAVCIGLVAIILTLGCAKSEAPQAAPSDTAAEEKPDAPASEPVSSEPVSDGPASSESEDIAKTQPFGDIATIPGVVEAENFDTGEANVAYKDVDPENQGAKDHREATEVDIEKREDATGGYGVGWTRQGEWLVYTVNVSQAGKYKIDIPVASEKLGGTFHIEFDGKDVTGPIQVPDTGDWGTLQTITQAGVQLEAGQQSMKIVMDTEGPSGSIGDIDHLKFSLEEN